MDKEASPWLGIVRSGNWFRTAPPRLQTALLQLATVRQCVDREPLFARGDPPDGLYCVASGVVRATAIAADGREALLALIEPPQWFGEISLLDGLPRTHSAWAQGPSVVLHVAQRPLLEVLEAEPQLWRHVGLLAASKLRVAFGAIEESSLLTAERRVAARLLVMAEGFGELTRHTRRRVPVSQDQLALMLSLSRQTVNQTLKALAQQGIVKTGRGSVELLDVPQLRDAAGRPPQR